METLQPKLRFPKFEEKYINKRVDDFAPLQRGFDLPITKMVKGKFPVVFSNGISKTHNEFKVKAPGIVTGRSGTIGNLFYIEEDFWPHNTSLWVTDFKGNFPKYVYYFYDKFDLKRFGTGSGVPTLNRNDVHNQQIYIPSPEEQTEIANFLSAVDEKLNLLKEKKTLLEDYKKGIMQKIFNQEIRFKDDNGNDFENWEEKSLESILKKIVDNRGKTPPVEKEGIPLLEVNSIGNKSINYNVVSKFVNDETYNSWLRVYLEKNDVIFSTVGNTALCSFYGDNIKACIAQNLVALRFTSEYGLFMYYLLTEKNNNEKFKSIEMGAVQPSVKVSQMIKLKFNIPKLEEQIKIANFLSAIDEKIELVSNQIQETQEYKKGLLQQMFV